MRLLDALTAAGGILPTGNKRQVQILRGNGADGENPRLAIVWRGAEAYEL